MIEKRYDVIIVGGGAAGLAAADTISKSGCEVAILEREDYLGGILMQCVHHGFGLKRFGEELTGPEYAEKYIDMVGRGDIEFFMNCTALNIEGVENERIVSACSKELGMIRFRAKAIVLAMGCRERNRGNIGTPGTRPSGIYTAGLAQRLINVDGLLPGKNVVILGSGDIGLIMARRLTWGGCDVKCVVEIMPRPSGLTRNIAQCLDDFGIPLRLSHAIARINGQRRIESVDVAPLENGVARMDKRFNIPCDTLLLSVGLVPENELSVGAGVVLNRATNGPVVDGALMTSENGIFACGNVLHVHDIVDFVSEEAIRCAENVIEYLRCSGPKSDSVDVAVRAGTNVRYVVPNRLKVGKNKLLARSLIVKDDAKIVVKEDDRVIASKKLSHVNPAEMMELDVEISEGSALALSLELE